jgi:hypothetical protein
MERLGKGCFKQEERELEERNGKGTRKGTEKKVKYVKKVGPPVWKGVLSLQFFDTNCRSS